MQLQEGIKRLEAIWELPKPLRQDLPGVYVVPLEEDLRFTIAKLGEEGFSLRSEICKGPASKIEEGLMLLLNANLFSQATEGALLGLNEAGTDVVLTRDISHSYDENQFIEIVESFINMIDFWREEMKQFR